jgi:uncharacterized protein
MTKETYMSHVPPPTDAPWLARVLIRLNNFRRSRRRFQISPEHVLLLLPRCLQNAECTRAIARDISLCQRCGKCPMKNIRELGEEFGVMLRVVNGGRRALTLLLDDRVEAVVAVACEPELKAGIAASSKPVLAITNLRPHGPCHETDVEIEKIRQAIEFFLGRRRAPFSV